MLKRLTANWGKEIKPKMNLMPVRREIRETWACSEDGSELASAAFIDAA